MLRIRSLLLPVAVLGFAAPLSAQQAPAATDEARYQQPISIQYFRATDKRGINVFETPKDAGVAYDGFRLQWGAAFTQQFQGLRHENTADSVPSAPGGTNNVNRLMTIGNGFNNAVANLYMHAQLAPGIRVQLTTYLSSRHHPETWVKDGFLQVDESPLDVPLFHSIMKYTTLKVGHFQVNYGDFQFRRTDNGNAMYNPLVGNALMDAFTTEIGTEVVVQRNGLLAVVAATGGEIRGQVVRPDDRAPAYIAKLGMDRQINDDLRVRLTGSYRTTAKSLSNSIYSGDRAGSRYYYVLENSTATEAAQFTSGRINPGFTNKSTGFMINPFVKFHGAEFFGMYERAKGSAAAETSDREVTQLMAEGLFRFGTNENLYIAGRWNNVSGNLGATAPDADVGRLNFGGGWFVTPSLLMKLEYVMQEYDGFVATNIRNGGKFNGFMIEGVLAF